MFFKQKQHKRTNKFIIFIAYTYNYTLNKILRKGDSLKYLVKTNYT